MLRTSTGNASKNREIRHGDLRVDILTSFAVNKGDTLVIATITGAGTAISNATSYFGPYANLVSPDNQSPISEKDT